MSLIESQRNRWWWSRYNRGVHRRSGTLASRGHSRERYLGLRRYAQLHRLSASLCRAGCILLHQPGRDNDLGALGRLRLARVPLALLAGSSFSLSLGFWAILATLR